MVVVTLPTSNRGKAMSDPISERDDIERKRAKAVSDAAEAMVELMRDDMQWNLRHRVSSEDTAIDEAEAMLDVALERIKGEAVDQFGKYLLHRP